MSDENPDVVNMKIVVVGDGAIGKTCLLMSYTKGIFPEEYVPTVFDNFAETRTITVEETKPKTHKVRLDLWDTAGQEEFDRIRPLSYRDANFFIVCFALDSKTSLEHVTQKWVPEVEHHAPDKEFLLVGLKSDLKDDPDIDEGERITEEDRKATMTEIGAVGYVECSALKTYNIEKVFNTAMEKYIIYLSKNKFNLKKTNSQDNSDKPIDKNSINQDTSSYNNNNSNNSGGGCCILL